MLHRWCGVVAGRASPEHLLHFASHSSPAKDILYPARLARGLGQTFEATTVCTSPLPSDAGTEGACADTAPMACRSMSESRDTSGLHTIVAEVDSRTVYLLNMVKVCCDCGIIDCIDMCLFEGHITSILISLSSCKTGTWQSG